MSAYTPLVTGRPVSAAPTDLETTGHFQSDDHFAMCQKWIARAAWAGRRSGSILTFIALSAALWAALPAICMALAGGMPA